MNPCHVTLLNSKAAMMSENGELTLTDVDAEMQSSKSLQSVNLSSGDTISSVSSPTKRTSKRKHPISHLSLGVKKLFNKKVSNTASGEETPLLVPPITTNSDAFPTHNPSALPSKRDPWAILKRKVRGGSFLLEGNAHKIQSRRQSQVQQAIDEIRHGMEFSLFHCLVAMFVYLAISVVCYNWIFESDWTMVDSVYFATVTFSTVGYGDQIPNTTASIIFTCLYALTGVSCLGVALGVLGSYLIEVQERLATRAEKMMKFQVLSAFEMAKANGESSHSKPSSNDGSTHESRLGMTGQSSSTNYHDTWLCLGTTVPLLCLLYGLAYWIGAESEWDGITTLYYLIITATTVGYGDLTPTTERGKLIAIFFIPLAVGATGVWLGSVANWILEARSSKYRRTLGCQGLTQRDLDVMDADGDGVVTRAEFLEFMLLAMNKIDRRLVDELREHFDRLDVDGTGELTKGDLIESARRKLRSPEHKIALAMYKKRLLEK